MRVRLAEWLKANLDPIDMFFGFLPLMAGYAAFVGWKSLIVREIRGEEAEEEWRIAISTAAFIAIRTLVTGTHVRETAALRGAAVEMRGLIREAAEDAVRRDERAADRDRRLTTLTKWLVALAGLTLLIAIVALTISIVDA